MKTLLVFAIGALLPLWPVGACAAIPDAAMPELVNTIIAAESSGRPHVVGDGGKARGLMQIQEATWKRFSPLSWDRAFDPAVNRQVGEKIVRDIARHYGPRATPALVIYTYNTGRFCKGQLPQWTRRHPNRIYRAVFQGGE